MTPQAIAARHRRNVEWETKRFNATMKEYIEIKYDAIYEEYCTFYESLASKHPDKKNLLKTSTFRDWKKATIKQSLQKDGVLSETTFPQNEQETEADEDTTSEFGDEEQGRDEQPQDQTESVQAVGGILSELVNEMVSDQQLVEVDQIGEVDNIVDEIIAELEVNEAIHGILNNGDDDVQQDDEGIALDFQTELEAVIEPFDFELEVNF